MTIAAPLPVFGFFDEAFFDRIAMDVAELFDKFLLRENVEVEVAAVSYTHLDVYKRQGWRPYRTSM